MPHNTSSSSLFGRLSTSTRSSFLSPKEVRCNVHMLHDSDIIANEFPRTQPAQTVLDYICELKKIQEKDFLGLRYQDHNKHRYWLDLTRSIGHVVKQFRTENLTLHLRFRYYPAEPTRIRDANLRYHLFVQLQRDLLHGRLYCPQTQAAELAALILQAQIGDYNEDQLPSNYVSGYKLLLRQTPKLEERIASIHKELKGKSIAEAELEFLEKASQLDTYAFDPYTIKDPQDTSNAVYLGASAKGILIYTGTMKSHHIHWSELANVDYSGRELKLTIAENYQPPAPSATASPTSTIDRANGPTSPEKNVTKKAGAQTLKYVCPSHQFAKHLWIHILSQQAFFNESSAQEVKLRFSKPRIPLLSRGSTFRFPSRRVYKEIEESFSAEENHSDFPHDQTHTDNELNTSSVSVPTVVRYELPRQEMRVEQPWLTKSTNSSLKASAHYDNSDPSSSSDQENNNNNKLKSTNLNISFDLPKLDKHDDTPSTSEAIKAPEFVHTVSPSDRNQERAESLEKEFNTNVDNCSPPGDPLASSTPRAAEKKNSDVNLNGKLPKIAENGDLKTFSNGHTVVEKLEKPNRSLASKITNSLFVLFLFALLLIAIVICVFERSDSYQNDWVEGDKRLSELRHQYYEPARHYVLEQYRRVFGAAK
ncbi:unnamed protein product [Caenorhabditis bovis]|uniref:FERM domain-containing protein n=1 Tax=Caenorhabditis bovis TaxID=2654633 RepID=A0A8S1F531_9PELO|nr:unnamed protein product [Caenorhabditis bovis]